MRRLILRSQVRCQKLTPRHPFVQARCEATASGIEKEASEAPDTNKAPNTPKEDVKTQIIRAALAHVQELGWTDEALVKGTLEVGHSPLTYKVVERGPVEIVELFLEDKRKFVKDAVDSKFNPNDDHHADSDEKLATFRREVLYTAMSAHVDYISPYIKGWPGAMALMAEPKQAIRSVQILTDSLDDFCSYARIETSRLDWYTERAALGALYTSVELYMLQDTSPEFNDTKEFLHRNIDRYSVMNAYHKGVLAGLQSTVSNIFSGSK
jgi:ubiquinone biosynthesis protein COQ9